MNGLVDASTFGSNLAAIQQAINAVGAGTVWCPGTFTADANDVTVQVPMGVRVVGPSRFGGTVSSGSRDMTLFNLTGHSPALEEIALLGRNAPGATQPVITVDAAASQARLSCVRVGYGGICLLDAGTDTTIEKGSTLNSAYGPAIYRKTQGNCWLMRATFDQDFPTSLPPVSTAQYMIWSSNTNVSANQIVKHPGNYYIQAVNAGQTGSSAPTLKPYGETMVDGGMDWLLVGAPDYTALDFRGSTSQVGMIGCDVTFGGWAGVRLDTTGAQHMIQNCTFALSTLSIHAIHGQTLKCSGNTFNNGVAGQNNLSYGMLLSETFGPSNLIVGNYINGYDRGIYLAGDANNHSCGAGSIIANNRIEGCRQAAYTKVAAVTPDPVLSGNNW